MSIANNVSTLHAACEVARKDLRDSLKHIPPTVLDRFDSYMQSLYEYELSLCASLTDDIKLRQSQGAVRAFQTIAEAIEHRPVEARRSTSRREV